ncbi:hypothetical protein Y1Q_0012510 [Alligator mississippiensis]|uniref:Uncharacterized protein n=1 Tax=Alligator mississippiensis TaxID=8496 RepID=A0A151M7V6_ALLMI|nr:hypothetical protein Y1Q_0012510 [Alligator mississippiensis]
MDFALLRRALFRLAEFQPAKRLGRRGRRAIRLGAPCAMVHVCAHGPRQPGEQLPQNLVLLMFSQRISEVQPMACSGPIQGHFIAQRKQNNRSLASAFSISALQHLKLGQWIRWLKMVVCFSEIF